MNTERIKLENFNGILYVEMCMGDEFTLKDLNVIREEIRQHFSSTTNLICKESGSYSVAADVQKILWKGIDEFQNVVYVVDDESKRSAARYAAETYMRKYNARIAGTKEAACKMLCE